MESESSERSFTGLRVVCLRVVNAVLTHATRACDRSPTATTTTTRDEKFERSENGKKEKEKEKKVTKLVSQQKEQRKLSAAPPHSSFA